MARALRSHEEVAFAQAMGERIRDLRIGRGYTQAALIRHLPPTVDGSTLSKWEHGHSSPSSYALVMLAAALGVTTDHLLRGD